jgi:hypothetical protein
MTGQNKILSRLSITSSSRARPSSSAGGAISLPAPARRRCLARYVEIATATTRAPPSNTSSTQFSAPARLSPLTALAMRSTPTTVPATLYLPVLIVVALRNTAVSTGNSRLGPSLTTAPPLVATIATPATPARPPDTRKQIKVIRVTRIPTSCAARLFEPTAWTYRPNGVCPSVYQPTSTTTATR